MGTDLGAVLVGIITVEEASMATHVGRLRGSVAALRTLIRLLASVCPPVLGQVTPATEPLVAVFASVPAGLPMRRPSVHVRKVATKGVL